MPELLEILLSIPNDWEKSSVNLIVWSKEIADTWQEVTHNKITADDSLSITVILLPNEINILKKIEPILNKIYLESSGDISFIMTTLYAAVCHKISLITHTNNIDDIDNNIINAVIEELKMKSKIKIIIKNCEDYKKYLQETMRNTINKDKSYTAYFSTDHDQFVAEIIESVDAKMFDSDFKKILNVLVKKYLLINDMLITLTKPTLTAWKKQIVFSEKFTQHYEFFKKNKPYFKFINFFYNKTAEDIFLESAEVFTKTIKQIEKDQYHV